MNTIRQSEPETRAKVKGTVKPKKGKQAIGLIRALNMLSFFDKGSIIRIMPYFFFLTCLAILYIANSYMAEKIIRNIDKTNKDLKELRSEYISSKSELMFRSKQTEVARAVFPLGIRESVVAPKKIVVQETAN